MAQPLTFPTDRIAAPFSSQKPSPRGPWSEAATRLILPQTTEAAAGYVGTSIFNAVQVTNLTNIVKIILDVGHPIGVIEEIVNGLVFATAGPNAPHFQYGPYVAAILAALQKAALEAQADGVPLLLVTINGTGVPNPFDDGPTSFPGWLGWDVATPWNAIYEQFYGGPWWWDNVIWLPCGYEAAVQNMWSSVEGGAFNTLQQITTGGGLRTGGWPVGTRVFIFGYSQGAMVANYIGVNYMLDPNGPLHDRFVNGDLVAIWNVGDPNRTPGYAAGNDAIGLAMPPKVDGTVTGGISGPGIPSEGVLGCLTLEQTQELNVNSIVLAGDLYADAPVGLLGAAA